MPPKKSLKSIIPKTTSTAKSASAKPIKGKDTTKKNTSIASEIDDIFSTGTITSSSTSKSGSHGEGSKKKDQKDIKKKTVKVEKALQKSSKNDKGQEQPNNGHAQHDGFDDGPMGDSLADSEDDEEVNEEDLYFDEEEHNESEEAAIAKLMAKKKSRTDTEKSTKSVTPAVVSKKPRSGAKVVEAVVFNERPAAAAAAAATAKIQKFKRARDDGPDSDDELEKKGKRKTDDGLRLFDINDLNIGKGGETDKCPFDCECCF
ncbi:hypothetical protein BGZ76_006265 [Entomortierella beljakovae]|nr:hypothetical protein BGZ76_006265 [Entomortierella beljakovae]